MNRPDLFALVGHRVTITGPGGTDPVSGRLAAYAESPTLILDLDDGQQWILPQNRCTVACADGTTPEPLTPAHRFRGVVHNAIAAALRGRGHWLPLSSRLAIADAVIAALPEYGVTITDRQDTAPERTS